MKLRFTCCILCHNLTEIWDQVWGSAISKLWIWGLCSFKSRVLRVRREEDSGICVRV